MDKGLPNIGNTCYINSVLQCLRYSKPFVFQLCNMDMKDGSPLLRYFVDLLFDGAPVRTLSAFVGQLAASHSEFRLLRQCDAHELFLYLIDQFFTRYKTTCKHSFEGTFLSSITCIDCGNVSNSTYPFISVSVDMDRSLTESVETMLERFSSVETLDDPIDCTRCKKKMKSKKQLTIKKLPTILVFHLKRFQGAQKLCTPVKLEPDIHIHSTRYRLYAICNHTGGVRGGHYTASCRRRSGAWIMCNDNFVTEMSALPATSSHPYLLFYTSDFKH